MVTTARFVAPHARQFLMLQIEVERDSLFTLAGVRTHRETAAHLHDLDYQGLTQAQALEKLQAKKAELEQTRSR